MYQKKLLFWVSFFFYLISIYSILVAIWLFEQGESVYFYTFVAIYSVDKIITFFVVNSKSEEYSKSKTIVFWILDVFSLGFIYIFFSDEFFYDTLGCLITKTFIRVLPQIIIEFIFFFCLGQLQNTQISQFLNIASFFNFILFTFLYATLLSIVNFKAKYMDRLRNMKTDSLQKSIINFVQQFIFTITYQFTLVSLIFYKDTLGINLIYYQLVLIFIDLVVLIFYQYYRKQQLNFEQTAQLILAILGINNIQLEKINLVQIINYFNQVVRVVLLLLYSLQILPNIFKNQDAIYDQMKFSITVLSFKMSQIYFTFLFKNVLKFFIKQKYFQIKQLKDFDIVTLQLNKKFKYVKLIEIFINQIDNKYNQHSLQQLIIQQSNQQILELLQAISFQLKLNMRICTNYDQLTIDNVEILTKVEHLQVENYTLNDQLNQIINQNIPLDHIILQRLQNGFIQNSYTKYLLTLNNISNKQSIYNYISYKYQITAFYKILASQILFSPHQTILDLYLI